MAHPAAPSTTLMPSDILNEVEVGDREAEVHEEPAVEAKATNLKHKAKRKLLKGVAGTMSNG